MRLQPLLFFQWADDSVSHTAITHIELIVPTQDGNIGLSEPLDKWEPIDFLERLALKLGTTRDTMYVGFKFPSDGAANRLKDEGDAKKPRERWIAYRKNPRTLADGKVTIVTMVSPILSLHKRWAVLTPF